MSSSLLTAINVPKTNKEIVEQLHKALVDRNLQLAEQLSLLLMKDRSTQDTWICNITDQDLGPLDMWHYMAAVAIPRRLPGEKYSVYRIVPHVDHMDLGDNRFLEVPVSSYDTAVDICDKFNNHIGRGSYSGVFVIADGRSVPSEAELAEASRKLLSWDLALISEGDTYFDRNRKEDISDLHRNAARRLGLKKPWLPENQLAAACPVCGSDIKPGVAVCPNCTAILDPVRYAKFSFVGGEPAAAVKTPPVVEDHIDLLSDPDDDEPEVKPTTVLRPRA